MDMRCLYLVAQEPITPNYVGGGSAMYYDQLLALSDLGHEIHLWHYASGEGRGRFERFIQAEPAIWDSIQERCKTVRLTEYANGETLIGRGLGRMRSFMPPHLPVSRWRLHKELQEIMRHVQPDVVWAQHFEPAMLAAQHSETPVVYVHHDWLYRIKALRGHREINHKQEALEQRLVRSVAAVVSGSAVECEEIKAAGAHGVHYIPVSFDAVPVDLDRTASGDVRLVHLGGMGTTANREGLAAFFRTVWPRIDSLKLRLDVIGDVSAAPPELGKHLSTVNCTGFVQDLTKVLRPYDIHIIPWEHATGQRTRLPLAFNYAQAVVATKAAVACYPEARDGENCRLAGTLEEMISIIPQLAADHAGRARLGKAARATFEKQFTRAALLPRYGEVLGSLHLQ
jgi:glycosyltransferase involved in cell wall biosynthesis